jgi:hypothetical protein
MAINSLTIVLSPNGQWVEKQIAVPKSSGRLAIV